MDENVVEVLDDPLDALFSIIGEFMTHETFIDRSELERVAVELEGARDSLLGELVPEWDREDEKDLHEEWDEDLDIRDALTLSENLLVAADLLRQEHPKLLAAQSLAEHVYDNVITARHNSGVPKFGISPLESLKSFMMMREAEASVALSNDPIMQTHWEGMHDDDSQRSKTSD